MIREMYNSAQLFRIRFSLESDIEAAVGKVYEEIEEFVEATRWYKYYFGNNLFRSASELSSYKDNVAKELMDITYAGMSLMINMGVGLEEIEAIAQSIIDKNDAKNLTNCTVVNGQVVRNEKLVSGGRCGK